MLRYALAFGFAFALAGCSTTTLDSAAKLGASGQAASGAMTTFIDTTADGYQGYVDGLTFASSYPMPSAAEPKPASPPCNIYGLTPLSAQARKDNDDYFDTLAKTRTFFVRLSKAYEAFAALASYDAQTNIQNGLEGAVSAANDLLSKLNEPAIPDNVGALIGTIGGLFARHAQEDAVLQASEQLRAISAQVSAAMKAHRGAFLVLRNLESQTSSQVAYTLWCAGLVDVHPLLPPLVQDSGLSVTDAPLSATDPAVRQGIEAILAARAQKTKKDIGNAFDQITDGLDKLVQEHKKLEAGTPVDVGSLMTLVTNLDHLAELYSGAKGK